MPFLKVAITRFVDDHQPGFVECTFVDARGIAHTVIEKVPIVTTEHLSRDSQYPREGAIACTIVGRTVRADGELLMRVDTTLPDHVESQQGETVFEVSESLVE
jgi:hypothetical protein